jgi:hypothetical protein
MLGLTDGTQLGSPGVCEVPRLAVVASGQEAIRELWVGLMERQRKPASWAADEENGSLSVIAVGQGENRIQRRTSLSGFRSSLSSNSSSLSWSEQLQV